MGLIKRTPADAAFSKCVRALTGWKCKRCGAQHDKSSMGLHCSHFHSRGNWGVRFDPDNAFAHCYGCHQYLGGRPEEFKHWVLEQLGEGRMEILRDRKNDTGLGKMYRQTKGKGEIAKHFREQLTLIEQGQDYIEPFL